MRLKFLILLIMSFSTTSWSETAGDIDWKSGAWGHLSQYIGTYNYSAVLDDPAVADKLGEMLGDDVPLLEERLFARSPIGFSGTCLILRGNARRRGFVDTAYMNVCPHSQRIDVVIASEVWIRLYTDRSTYGHLDPMIRSWIKMHVTDGHFSDKPDEVTMY